MERIFNTIDSLLNRSENRFGKVLIALIIGCFLLFLAGLISAVRFETFYHGNGFTRLSLHPFEMKGENDLRFRILSPLIGFLLFMRGPLFKYFMLFVLAIFFGVVYLYLRKKKLRPSESIGVTALLSFSTLTFYQLYFPAYTDPLSFLLIVLFMCFYRNNFIATLLLTLMLFNHENTIFLFPFFFLLMADWDFILKKLLRIAGLFVIAIVPYIIFRKIIIMNAEVAFTTSFYFDPGTMKWTRDHVAPHLVSGMFQAFRLAWIIPIVAIAIDIYQKKFRELILIVVVLIFVHSQLLIAWDISRLIGMAFPVILISALRMKTFLGTEKFLMMTYAIILLNFIIPAYCIGALDPISYAPIWWR